MWKTTGVLQIIILSFFICWKTAGQEPTKSSSVFNPIINDISERLPTLQALIDSAIRYSPLIKLHDANISLNKKNILTEKRDWTSNLGMDANIRYGSVDNVVLSQTSTETADLISTTINTRYSTGLYIKLPLFDFVNRSNEIAIAKLEFEQAFQQKEQQIIELKKSIIVQYNDLLLKQKLLHLYNSNKETSELQLEMAENQFKNGRIELSDLARIQEAHTKAISSFETIKTEFIIAYYLLEEMTGINFNVKNNFAK